MPNIHSLFLFEHEFDDFLCASIGEEENGMALSVMSEFARRNVRRVMSRIRPLNLSRAFGAMRRSLASFEMLSPRNLRSSGRATALFASLTLSRSLLVKNRLTEAMTRSPVEHVPVPRSDAIGSVK